MGFRYEEEIEICSKKGGNFVAYYPATILAAVGKNRYIVEYLTQFNDEKTRFLTAIIDREEIRPSPPSVQVNDFVESDRVDVYLNGAWWVGRIVRKVDPNYYVRLDRDGSEAHSAFYRVRLHLDWEDGNWNCPSNRPKKDEDEARLKERHHK